MTQRFAVTVTVLVSLLIHASISFYLTAKKPINMNLQRVTYFNGTIIDTEREPKTKQKFFTQLLDLRSGANFTLNINKWKAIQESGLFYNLTARVHESPDGIVMDIKGKELPSITFAPEVSLSPSLDRPEISGGVLFKDRNFRGLGENFELLLLSKEGVEVHSNSAPLVVKLRWQDCTIGKLSRFSIGYDSEPFYDFMRNLLSTSMLRRTSMPTTGRNTRIRMPIQKKTAYIQYGLANSDEELTEKTGILNRVGRWAYYLKPYRSVVINGDYSESPDKLSHIFSGVESTLVCLTKHGHVVKSSYDGGKMISKGWRSTHPYHQIRMDCFSKMFTAPLQRLIGIQQHTTNSTIDPIPGRFNLLGKVKLSLSRTWGDGIMPLLHHTSFGDSSQVRGFPSSADTEWNHVESYGLIKADNYLEYVPWNVKVGTFIDSAVYNEIMVEKGTTEQTVEPVAPQLNTRLSNIICIGLSLRAIGLRCDVGYPLRKRSSTRIHLSLDGGD